MIIRPYEPRDREAVRRICCDTADAGQPVENFFSDREFIADLVTRYYTDIEPQYSWVAEEQGMVVGYLNGCLDSHRYDRIMRSRIGPQAVWRAIWRGAQWRAETWRWFAALMQSRRPVLISDYPAHLHVNVQSDQRGKDLGRQLVERFENQARTARQPGIHASVRGDNAGGRRFFERMGFVKLASWPMILPLRAGRLKTETVVYGKKL